MQMISYLGSTLGNGVAVPQVVSLANPLPVTLSGGIGGLAVAGTIAAGAAPAGQFPVTVGGIDGGGLLRQLLTDATGVLQVNASIAGGTITVAQGAGNTANPWTMQGPVASGAATSGNPVKGGATFNTTPPTVTTGQMVEFQATAQGSLRTAAGIISVSASDNLSNNIAQFPRVDQQSGSGPIMSAGFHFNGGGWDRAYKPRTAFRLPSSAATNNATNIKTTPGSVLGPITGNVTLAGSTCYLKFFDTTGAPNPAAVNPLYIFACNIVNGAFCFPCPAGGLYFPTGIGVAIVANPADLDNTAVAAGQVTALNVPFQ